MFSYLAILDVVNPTRYLGTLQEERVPLEELYVFLDVGFQVSNLQEINVVDELSHFGRCGVLLNDITQLWRIEEQHSAIGVMEQSDFTRSEKPLRDYDASDGV